MMCAFFQTLEATAFQSGRDRRPVLSQLLRYPPSLLHHSEYDDNKPVVRNARLLAACRKEDPVASLLKVIQTAGAFVLL